MITFQAGRHEREREGEGEHRLVQAHGRHSHPSATLREADTALLAQKRKGILAPDECEVYHVAQVREELPLLLQNTLNAHGAQTLSVSKFIPSIVAGLSDSQVLLAQSCVATD